jgi:hypothetical protein
VLIFDRFKTRAAAVERPDLESADIEPEIERRVEDFAGNLGRHLTTMSWGGTGLTIRGSSIGANTRDWRGRWLGLRGVFHRRRRPASPNPDRAK